MNVKIENIEYYLPELVVTNEDLKKENSDWDMDLLEKRVGVEKRHISSNKETALDLAFKACQKFFSKKLLKKEEIDGIIFCTQSEDYIMPPNSCILHKLLELQESVFAFDFNLACSGYIYGLALARGLINTGMAKNVLLINADTYSKYINPKDRSVKVLFGDGAALSWIRQSENTQGIIDIKCSTNGSLYDKFIIPAGGCRMPKSDQTSIAVEDESGNKRTLENIHMDGMGILTFVNSKVPQQIKAILKENNLTTNDIDLFIFHQASKMALDSLKRILQIKPEKSYENINKVGNLVSASIPICLKNALTTGIISKGDKVLLSGFGVGLSWGTAIIEI